MVSIIKVKPLHILVSGRKKKLSPHSFWEPIIKRALRILFCRGDSVFLIGWSCGVWCRGLTHTRIAWIRQLYNTLVSALGIPIMARFQILKGPTSTWSTLRNQLVYFRTRCFYNPIKYCILLSFHINIKFLNVFQTSPFCPYRVPDIATWSYQTRVFHLLITSWHIFPVHHFTLAPFFAFSLVRLSYINKSFVTGMSYLLPCAKFQRVTFFMKRSYLIPRENFKLPYLPNQAHWAPGICSQLRSSHIHSIHQKSSDFIKRELCVFGPYLSRLIQPRPRGEEGNCSYLLPLSHREW